MGQIIGVVADDTTGANDIGIMFSNKGYTAKVQIFEEEMNVKGDADVIIVDTDSRLDSDNLSYQKVYGATEKLQETGCSMFFKKTCSVFRGNIGKEFDAMLDALGEEFAIISLAFPKNGRTTIGGMHTVYGQPLECSAFANDPVHPMKESDLVSILQKQTLRKVTYVDLSIVRQGATVLRRTIEEIRKHFNYCIIDSETQSDLTIVAEAIHDYKILGGSSAIAEELPKFLGKRSTNNLVTDLNIEDQNGVLVVSGSLTPQTRAQTAHLISSGVPCKVFDSRKVFSPVEYDKEVMRVSLEAQKLLIQGEDVLIMADNNKDIILETKEMGKKLGIDPLSISKMVSAAISNVTKIIVDQVDLKRLIVAGGDTAGTVSRKLDIKGNYVLKEIETGLPSGLAIGRHMLIVLKSGSFGGEEFLSLAIKHLKNLSH
ncbi:four-carbon acid sugar kinase family protein [Priestia filamentosa]|uniref:four-carbon acid sugar kinase family protein n=1 Tax=Priestia filamentosa TaxID=1402861 RepID=UPI001FB2591B|nr:four-carbon acid sugar kinase family protein [Priestia filamentosa]UOE62778.1 four-carbon acid sugar kinase family protein [Priestia filamentosa]